MQIAARHNRLKRAALQEAGDSHFSISVADFRAILERLGMTLALELPFHSEKFGYDDTLFIYAGGGLLARFDTYHGDAVNSANVYYCWRPHGSEREWDLFSSGGWEGHPENHRHGDKLTPEQDAALYWAGHHDAREGVAHKIGRLRDKGAFLDPWPAPQFLWLCHYGDNESAPTDAGSTEYYGRLCRERLSLLPAEVQAMVGGGVR
ncbi:hypothetical protein TSO5_03505 [Azospirillum sp. TSO5]|nr:hypothetical protein TSO5_03505 [Azospirillum sp. TSO5]